MKHHFADFLDRENNYWSIVPNRQRFAYTLSNEIPDRDSVKVITISKHDEFWKQALYFKNLEEITLHEPSKEQVEALSKLTQITRLRITHFRTKNIDFISNLINLEELVLEYVSGFDDLAPLQKLKSLKSLHLENLRKVTNFNGLSGIDSLKYLHIDGTLDWNQPIENFIFLEGIPNLEVFSLGFIINKTEYPAFTSILKLKNLRKIKIGRSTLKTNEYAFIETAFPHLKDSFWELCWEYNEYFEFLGKNSGRVKNNNPELKMKCNLFIESYNSMKKDAEIIINQYRYS